MPQHAEVVGFDLVEVNPMLDVASENTSLISAQLIMEFLARIVEHPGYRRRHPARAVTSTEARRPTRSRRRPKTTPSRRRGKAR